MGKIRPYLERHRICAMWLVAAALLMKMVVPTGYMPVVSADRISVALCSGFGPEKMAMAMPGISGHRGMDHSAKGDMPCGFAGHAPAAMAGADPALLVIAIAFIFGTVFRIPAAAPIRRTDYLRPHLRGPPREPLIASPIQHATRRAGGRLRASTGKPARFRERPS